MAIEIEIRKLTDFKTAVDGEAVKLVAEDTAGRTVAIILTVEILSALVMTLPAMAASAVRRASRDPKARLTYPLREFQIEVTPDDLRILTVGTPDGFSVSFCLTEELSRELGRAHLKGSGRRARTH